MTDKDIEWLARSMWCEEEAGDLEGKIAVAWTHIQRFLLVNMRWAREGWPFYRYVQGHSQPVNPIWRRDGYKCRPGSKFWDNPTMRAKYCSESQLAKRDKCQTGTVPKRLMDLARGIADGKIENPFPEPTYDFAADWLVARQKRPCIGILAGKKPYNAHLIYECLKDSEKKLVIPGEVRVEGGAGLPPREISLPFIGIFLAGIGALYAWWLYSQ